MKALFDTNILIDYLRGIQAAHDELGRFPDKAISVVTWMEVMAGATPPVEQATRAFIDGFALIGLDQPAAQRALALRQRYRMKLPDAIVWASAQVHDRLLVSRDAKAFPPDDPGVRIPYRV